MTRPTPSSTLFPYTTLFRSEVHHTQQPEDHGQAQRQEPQRGPEDEAVQELWQQDRDEIIQRLLVLLLELPGEPDRKSTRLNSSHTVISYAVFCLKKKSTTST